jgi:hypothetical protein
MLQQHELPTDLVDLPEFDAFFSCATRTRSGFSGGGVGIHGTAAFTRRTVAVPVTSGVSAIIMPDGRITQRTGMFVADSLVQKVPLRSSTTPATDLGVLPEIALVLVAAGGLGWSIGAGVRGRRTRDA